MPRAELDNDGIRDDFPYLVRGTGNFSVEDLFCLPVRDDLAHAVFRVGSSFNPVSYTHLDVYKRQLLGI